MSKVILGVGHTLMSPGAKNVDGLYEQPFNYHVAMLVQRSLMNLGGIDVEVIPRTIDDYGSFVRYTSQHLMGRCEHFYELHFNSSTYPAKGGEVLCLKDTFGEKNAIALADKWKIAGWETRGYKGVYYVNMMDRGYELLARMEASGIATTIVEPCFGNSKKDPNYDRVFLNDGKGYAELLANFIREWHYGVK